MLGAGDGLGGFPQKQARRGQGLNATVYLGADVRGSSRGEG